MTLQFRPATVSPDREWYNPMRDLANVGLYIAQGGMKILDQQLETTEYQKFLIGQNVSVKDLEKAAEILCQVMALIETHTLTDAKYEAGFADLPLAVRLLILSALGEAFLDATFICVKDVLFSENSKPMGLEELQAAIKEALKRHAEEFSPNPFVRGWFRIKQYCRKYRRKLQQLWEKIANPRENDG